MVWHAACTHSHCAWSADWVLIVSLRSVGRWGGDGIHPFMQLETVQWHFGLPPPSVCRLQLPSVRPSDSHFGEHITVEKNF